MVLYTFMELLLNPIKFGLCPNKLFINRWTTICEEVSSREQCVKVFKGNTSHLCDNWELVDDSFVDTVL